MNDQYKFVESSRYVVGERFSPWNLIVGLYQHYQDYFLIAFDEDDGEQYIQSAIVTPASANYLESAIIEVIQRPQGLDNIQDVFDVLKANGYEKLFQLVNAED